MVSHVKDWRAGRQSSIDLPNSYSTIDLRVLAEYDMAVENIKAVMDAPLQEESQSASSSAAAPPPPAPTFEAATTRKRQSGRDEMPAPPDYPPSLSAEDMKLAKEYGLDKKAIDGLARLAEVSRSELEKLLRKLPTKGASINNPSAFVCIGVQNAIAKVTDHK